MWTKKAYYDRLVEAARDGTSPSVCNGLCLYRGEQDGQACAVGILLTDEEVEIIANSDPLFQVNREHPELKIGDRVEGLDLNDLANVQRVHDSRAHIPEWDADKFIEGLNKLSFFKEFAS